MRSNRGITLISLIVYIIVFTIVISTVTTISRYFVKNTDEVIISTDVSNQYTRLTTYLTEDLNSINVESVETDTLGTYILITFLDKSTHKYVYNNDNKKIYYVSEKNGNIEKKIALCGNITSFNFNYDKTNHKLAVEISLQGITYKNNYSI